MANHTHEVEKSVLPNGNYLVTCKQCERKFEAKRSDAAFCDAQCRVTYRRELARQEDEIASIEAMGRAIYRLAEKYKHSDAAFRATLKAQAAILAALDTFDDEPVRLPGF